MSALRRWLMWSLISLGVITIFLRLSAIRWWRIPADDPYLDASITPSLRGGDLVLLWRMTPPSLGSLALCPEPKHPERVVIGRMMGEERNTVKIDGSRVLINERQQSTEGSCADEHFKVTPPTGGAEVEQHCSMEVVSGLTHMRGDAEATAELAAYEVELHTGQVALVSDNRRFPYDSRDYGVVERSTCTETVFFRLVGAEGFFDASRRFQYVR
ncbi:MAG TPA: S26 family signal peptidase [Polyangiaceae bacterium]|nr:S26 family signal peptidase [Polyangiaceae bacterium]